MANIFSTILADLEAEWAKLFGTSGATISEAVVTDIKLVGSGLTGAMAEFEAVTGLDAALVTTIEGYITSIQTAASSIATTVATNIAKPIVTQIAADFEAMKTELETVTLPEAVSKILAAVETVLPFIEAGVGILTAATVGAAEATGLSRSEAESVLSGTAHA
jgi:hypothetical protein